MGLERSAIIETALDLLNNVGLEQLSTRKLATILKVQQPALYWHFKSKGALLEALAEAILTKNHTYMLPKAHDRWDTFLSNNAKSFRTALRAYRDGARVHVAVQPTQQNLSVSEAQLDFLISEGFSLKQAIYALVTLSHYVVGSVLEEEGRIALKDSAITIIDREQTPHLAEAITLLEMGGDDALFEEGLNALLRGFGTILMLSAEK